MEWVINIWNTYSAIIMSVLIRIALICGILIVAKVLQKIMKHTWYRLHSKYNKIDATVLPVLVTITNYCIYGIACIIILDIFGVNTTSIVTVIGAAGIAIGISLKDTLSNIASGIMLFFLRPFSVNDYVECASIAGTVERIDLFTTNFKTVDGIFIAVPNSAVFASAITNYSYNKTRRICLSVGIAYSDSIETGMSVLYAIAKEDERIIQEGDNAPYVIMKEMADSSITLELRMWTNIDVYWNVYWETNKKIKERIESAGLSIPFPIRTVYMESDKV